MITAQDVKAIVIESFKLGEDKFFDYEDEFMKLARYFYTKGQMDMRNRAEDVAESASDIDTIYDIANMIRYLELQ